MKGYFITFDALTSNDEVVGTLELRIALPEMAFTERKEQALHRLCVEYARLSSVPCSFARIINVKEEREQI